MSTTSLEFVITAVDKASKVLDNVGGAAEKSGGKFDKFRTGANVAAAAAGAALVKFGADSIEAYKEAEAQHVKLEDAFARFPALANTNIEALDKLNSAIQRKTGMDDDDLAAGQAVLAQYGLTGQQIQQLTPLVADFAAKTGTDLNAAFEQVGKSMLGQGRALKSVGIDFKDTGSVAGNFDQVLTGLTGKVSGFAETAGNTAAGKAAIFNASLSDLKENVGAALTPALNSLVDIGSKVLQWLTDTPGAMQAVAIALGVMAVAWLAMNVAASPWLAIGVAIAVVIAGVIVAIKNWGKIVDWLKGVWGNISSWFSGVLAGVERTFSRFVEAAGKIFKGIANVITAPFRLAFNGLAKIWNSTVGKISVKIPDWVPGIGGKGFDVPDLPMIPAFARGVTDFRGGYALVGERGPEVVRLPRGSDVIPNGDPAGGNTFHIYESSSPEATARQVARRLAMQAV